MAAFHFLASIAARRFRVPETSAQHFGTTHPHFVPMLRIPLKVQAMQAFVHNAAEDDSKIELAKKKCVPCNSKELRPMDEEAAKFLLPQVPGWNLVTEAGNLKLQRSWKAKSFLKGLEFFKRIADVAEAEGHHPNLHLVNWNDINVEIWTHAIGGLTENDFILAAKITDLNVQDLLRKRITGGNSSTS